MKRIINNKKYDTETARKIGEYWNGIGFGEFQHYFTELYKKKTGEFFKVVRTYPPNNSITPISDESARFWLENYSNAETYEELFGSVAE